MPLSIESLQLMHPRRFQFPILSLIAMILMTGRGIEGPALAEDSLAEKVPTATDPYAGRVVSDTTHLDAMVRARLRNAPTIGSKAPPMILIDAATGKEHRLKEVYTRKPTVLFFASFSCFCSQKSVAPVMALAQRYSERFQFLLVYIREAHPSNGIGSKSAGREFSVPDTNRLEDRITMALKFGRQHRIPFPILVDSMDDRNAVRWGAWPTRLFVIDRSGTVVYAGQQGPWFVKPTKDFDLGLHGVPESIRDLPGYSRTSLEEFLARISP